MEILEDIDLSIQENTTSAYTIAEDLEFEGSNTTSQAKELVKVCVNSTEDKSKPKELQFVRNIVF